MEFSITLRNLPFSPDESQIIYVENEFDKEVNSFVLTNYRKLSYLFEDYGYQFVYLPLHITDDEIQEKVLYYAPYLTSEIIDKSVVRSSMLLDYMANPINRPHFRPSLLFCPSLLEGDSVFRGKTIDVENYRDRDICDFVEDFIDEIGKFRRYLSDEDEFPGGSSCNYMLPEDPEECSESIRPFPAVAEESCCFDFIDAQVRQAADEELDPFDDVEDLLASLEETVKRLRLNGISNMAIHELIDKQEKVSRMVITSDYRIFLPDYNNMEIEMGALPKALYFLFLRYPEGLRFKCIQDHYTELLNIYRQLRPNTKEETLKTKITRVTNPLGNAINENVARIRNAFVEKFDVHLAEKYLVTGDKGENYSVRLDRNLITWEED